MVDLAASMTANDSAGLVSDVTSSGLGRRAGALLAAFTLPVVSVLAMTDTASAASKVTAKAGKSATTKKTAVSLTTPLRATDVDVVDAMTGIAQKAHTAYNVVERGTSLSDPLGRPLDPPRTKAEADAILLAATGDTAVARNAIAALDIERASDRVSVGRDETSGKFITRVKVQGTRKAGSVEGFTSQCAVHDYTSVPRKAALAPAVAGRWNDWSWTTPYVEGQPEAFVSAGPLTTYSSFKLVDGKVVGVKVERVSYENVLADCGNDPTELFPTVGSTPKPTALWNKVAIEPASVAMTSEDQAALLAKYGAPANNLKS